MTPPRKTAPGGIPLQDYQQYTPPPVALDANTPTWGSRVSIAAISTALAVLVSTIAIVGFVGKYFYVDRTEYSEKALRESEERGQLRGVMGRVDATLVQMKDLIDRQEKAIDRMSETVKSLELRQAGRR
jgi:hypothetical protein